LKGSGINQQESITQHGSEMAVPMGFIVSVIILFLDCEGIVMVVPQGEFLCTISYEDGVHRVWLFSLVDGIE
jgi:hypothetical protein